MSAIVSLTQLNIWLDVVFTSLYAVVLVALVIHFLGSIPKGRFRKKFILKKWPEHDHAPGTQPKLLHHTHMLMMIVLAISGLYIRFPFFDGGRMAMRYIHYFAMIVVTINLIWRLWYAFFSKQRDWREFAITKEDAKSALGVILYYSYISNSKPHTSSKYNVMQKFSYQFFLVLMLLQAYTGFALVFTPIFWGYSPRDILVGWWLGVFVGSTDLAGWYARTAHYVINWLFIIMTTIHVYLSATEDVPVTLDFFFVKDLEIKGGHGHAPEPHAVPAAGTTAGDQ
ncbi:MAG: cytochrome b/b6 domain-containing protein [Anaerosomatales bacterium]|nr:cytochrome b/b6 domain-containing protein [Anaerosomatales bacterium]MDT8434098.1 cytochrome b/b6 domain-containing protein [Anaerosomatales bacterium]